MSMVIVRPLEIGETELTSSTVAEDTTPAWDSGATYASGARRHLASTHRVYQSLQDSNTNKDPETETDWWVDVGPTNRWAMFDSVVQSSTVTDEDITVIVEPGPISAIALLQLNATSVRVVMRDEPGGAVVYDRTVSLESTPITDWYVWTVAPFRYRREMVLLDLPLYPIGELEVTISGQVSGTTECGVFAVGTFSEIGDPQYGISIGGIDYSRVTTDQYGTTSLARRASAKELDFELIASIDDLDSIVFTLDDLRATPAVAIPSLQSRFAPLIVFGIVEQWKAGLPANGIVKITGRWKGLT